MSGVKGKCMHHHLLKEEKLFSGRDLLFLQCRTLSADITNMKWI